MLTATLYAPTDSHLDSDLDRVAPRCVTAEQVAAEQVAAEPLSQNEISVSDWEITERVRKIRSGWSVAERVERRREAERRFADLIERLAAA